MIGQALGSTKSLRTNTETLLVLGQLSETEKATISEILVDLSEIIQTLTRLNNARKNRG